MVPIAARRRCQRLVELLEASHSTGLSMGVVNKCCLCFPLKEGCLIFGYCTAVVYGILCICGIADIAIYLDAINKTEDYVIMELNRDVINDFFFIQQDNQDSLTSIPTSSELHAVLVLLILAVVFLAVAVMFSGFLIHGVQKERVGFVKAYFVYGVVAASIDGLLTIISFFEDKDIDIVSVIMLYHFVWYIYFLMVVYSTYRGMQEKRALAEPFSADVEAFGPV